MKRRGEKKINGSCRVSKKLPVDIRSQNFASNLAAALPFDRDCQGFGAGSISIAHVFKVAGCRFAALSELLALLHRKRLEVGLKVHGLHGREYHHTVMLNATPSGDFTK